MNLKNILTLSAIVIVLASCGSGMKLQSAQRDFIKQTTESKEREEYVFIFEKKADAEFDIKEVRVFDAEGKLIQPLGYVVKTTDRKNAILNLKGYDKFAVVATYPGGQLNAESAQLVYVTEDGKQKIMKVKSFSKD